MENRDSSATVQSQRSSKRNQMAAARDWGDLPCELLPFIADRLGLIELLSFRGVCKDWKSNSSTASAEIEALPDREPWFLLYGGENNNSQCTLVSESSRKYSINIPELDGAHCLASNQGWLLLFREGSMFFFCLFSRAKIDLPGPFPLSEISDRYIAVFSAPPTKEDCVVCVCSNGSKTAEILELYVIHRGDTAWTKHEHRQSWLGKIDSSAYHNGTFYFFDDTDSMAHFSIRNEKIRLNKVIYTTSEREASLTLSFSSKRQLHDMKMRLGLEEGSFPVSTCGTIVTCQDFKRIIRNENICRNIGNEPAADDGRGHSLKGVWFQPRFHQIDQNLRW